MNRFDQHREFPAACLDAVGLSAYVSRTLLLSLSTVADAKISKRPWVNFQSAGWVSFQSAPTVTDPASLEKLAVTAFEHLGRIDAVVNLAGISPRKPIEDYTLSDVDDLLAINVKGPIFVTQAFLPGLRKQASDGVIVHIGGAMDGRVALPFMSAYAATRGALASYVQGANRELEGTNVSLSFFGPAPSNTESESPFFDMWKKMGVDLCEPDEVARDILATIRQRRKEHVMGGALLKMMTLMNAISPSAADAIGLRKFGKLIKQYSPR
jgi:NAD(P)-dependent dehydrogenase (short-subunit alcohol dehydrogenase family)